MTATSKGTMVYGSVCVAMLCGVLAVSIWSAALLSSQTAAAKHPAKIGIEWPRARFEAETGPNETRHEFAADVVSVYKTLNKEVR